MGVVVCGQSRVSLELKDTEFVVKTFTCELGKLLRLTTLPKRRKSRAKHNTPIPL